MYYHASSIAGIKRLEPHISNHGIPLVYFSKKRENVLVYLSNAVEKYCRETGFDHRGRWQKWGPYGFNPDGTQRLEEYYPNALEKTYRGVAGYIYSVEHIAEAAFDVQIPDAAASRIPAVITGTEFIPDACAAILQAEKDGLLTIVRYEEMTEAMREWNRKTIREEYESAIEHPEYRHFLRGNFPDLIRTFPE